MRQMKQYAFALLLISGVFGLENSRAQNVNAALHGTVTDTTGAVIPDATVTVLNVSVGITTVAQTDKSGYYILPKLQVGGPYTVTITAVGFEKYAQTGLILNVDDNREVNAKLKIGAATQTVEVSAAALQVETSNTQLQQIVDSGQLESIPLEGRDPAGLQKLETGVVESSDRFGTFSSNGSQTAQNAYLLNGVDINDPALGSEGIQINPDALEEENIVTSTMNPEFSRNSGATVNQILKSGTNTLHGSGFEFYRDTFLNNGNYFSPIRPVFHQNLYGGTLGGPIFKDKFFFFLAYQGFRNRTAETYVQTTMDSDQRAGNFTKDTNYATGARNSAGLTDKPIPFNIVTSTGTCVANPGSDSPETWADCFSTGTVNIPTAGWNSIASGLTTQFVPPANYGAVDVNSQQNEFNFNALNTGAEDQGIIKLDYTPTAKDSIWTSIVFQSSPGTSTLTFGGGSFPGFGSVQANHYKLFSAAWTHSFSSTKLNVLRAAYYRNPFGAVSPAKIVTPSSFGFSINPQDHQSGVPYIGIGNYFNLGFSFEGPQPRLDTNLTYSDGFMWVMGNHAFKFGASFEQFRVRNPFDVYNNGYFSFGGGGTYSSGDPYIDFALGIPDYYAQTNNGFINALSEELYGYAQDNWKMNADLTFNYGIGWDVEKPYTDHQDSNLGVVCFQVSNSLSKVFPGTAGNTPPPGMSWPGDSGCNNAGGPTAHYSHFAPRIGFAWSPSSGPSRLIGTPGAHDFSVRAGFGLYFNRDQEEQSLQNLTDPPFVQTSYGAGDFGGSPAFANPFADVTGVSSEANPFPVAPVTPKSTLTWSNYAENDIGAFDKNYTPPYTYNYNLNIQRSLGANLVLQVGYVGSVSHRLSTWYEGDPITSAGHAACLADTTGCAADQLFIHRDYPQYTAQPALAPNGAPWYLSVGVMNSEGSSNYNSLQASLRLAPTHGLQLTASYTYSHALDDSSGYESGTGGANGRVRNYVPGFKHLNYGSSDFDARQRLSTSYVYTVPVFAFMKGNLILREALSGWGVAGVTALQSGNPVAISEGAGGENSLWCDYQSYFGCGDVPQTSTFSIRKLNPRSSGSPYFSTSSFSAEPLGTFGNTTRNFFHGPGFDYTNLQLYKNIHFRTDSKQYMQLRLEAFNTFNHANFANPVGVFNSEQFGKITSVDYSADPNGDPSPGRAIQISGKIYF
jgi:hypothetical protein